MAKKALYNLTTGEIVIEQGKVYRDEDVANIDATNFEEVEDTEINADTKTGVVGDETPTEEIVTPELDTESVEEEKKSDVSTEEVDEEIVDETEDTNSEDIEEDTDEAGN